MEELTDPTEAQQRIEAEITEAAFDWTRTVSRPSSLDAFRAGARWMAHFTEARLNANREQQPPANCPACGGSWWKGYPPACMKCGEVALGWTGTHGVLGTGSAAGHSTREFSNLSNQAHNYGVPAARSQHVCGAQGFDGMLDVCPACEANRAPLPEPPKEE